MDGKTALMIRNPAAGRKRAGRAFDEAAARLSSMGYFVLPRLTEGSGDARALVERYGPGSALLVSCGGDGTLNEIVSAAVALGLDAPICHLPLGTTNDVAKTLRLPRSFGKIAALCGEAPVAMDAGFLNGGRLFTYVAAFGAFTDTAYLTPQAAKNRFGYAAYVLGGARSLGSLRPYEATVTAGSSVHTGRFIYGSVSNSASIGGILRLGDDQFALSDGKMELFLIRYPETPAQLAHTLACLAARRYDGDRILLERAGNVSFAFDKPAAWTIDGERAGAFADVSATVKRRAYHIFGNFSHAPQKRRARRAPEALAHTSAARR